MVENYETLIFEAHSTDYQTPIAPAASLCHSEEVGPALTFALREKLSSLAAIEEELVPAKACSEYYVRCWKRNVDHPGILAKPLPR